MDRLSSNVLLCLFDGVIAMIDIYQKSESLHFGFDANPDNTSENPSYSKKLRNQDGSDAETSLSPITVSWRGDSKNRVVDIDQLQKCAQTNSKIKAADWNVAQFAMQMIEGVEKVQFAISTPQPTTLR